MSTNLDNFQTTVDKETGADKPNNDKETDKKTDKETTDDSKKIGCNSSLALPSLLSVGAIGIVFVCKKKKED